MRQVIILVISFLSCLSLIFRYKMTQDGGAFQFTGIPGVHIFFFQCSLVLALNILFSNQPICLICSKCFNIIEEVFCMQQVFVSKSPHNTGTAQHK